MAANERVPASDSLSIRHFLEATTRIAANSLGAPSAIATVMEPGQRPVSGQFHSAACREAMLSPFVRKRLFKRLLQSKAAIIVPDLAEFALGDGQEDGEADLHGAFLGVPAVGLRGTICGAICVVRHDTHEWQAKEIEILRDLAQLVADRCDLIELKSRRVAEASEQLSSPLVDPRREAPSDVLCVFDSEGCVIQAGARAVEVWGYEARDLVGKTLSELLGREEEAEARAKLQGARDGGRRADMANVCIGSSGRERKVYWSALWCAKEQTFYAISRNQPLAPVDATATGDPTRRILVVDDYQEIALLVRTALQFSNFTDVVVAKHPERALDIARKERLSLIIADLRMEPINGVELLHEIRRIPHLRDVPYIIISGYLNAEVIEHLKHAGVTSFLAKPFRAADVVRHAISALKRVDIEAA